MNTSWLFWLLLNLATVICLAFFSMMEMACISFNKVRLHYYISEGNKKAALLFYMIQHPFRLFGTTLIGVNLALVVGSEASRQLYSTLGLNPDLSPLTQVVFVIIFGELAPMFAARSHAEDVSMKGAYLLYGISKLFSPLLFFVGLLSKITERFLGIKRAEEAVLNIEELQQILNEQTDSSQAEADELNLISHNIFGLKAKKTENCLLPLNQTTLLPSNATIRQMKDLLQQSKDRWALIYYKEKTNIVGVAFPRDLLKSSETKRIRDFARAPWFVAENTDLTTILEQFKRNNEDLAVILNARGKAMGVVTLNQLLVEIFGNSSWSDEKQLPKLFVEKTFAADITLGQLHTQFGIFLDKRFDLSLKELLEELLGHYPEAGESVFVRPFELTVKEASFLEVKSITIKTRH